MSTALDRYRAKHPGKSDEELLAAATTELDRIQEGQASLASALSGTVETLLQRNIAPKEDRASAHRSALGAVLDALQRALAEGQIITDPYRAQTARAMLIGFVADLAALNHGKTPTVLKARKNPAPGGPKGAPVRRKIICALAKHLVEHYRGGRSKVEAMAYFARRASMPTKEFKRLHDHATYHDLDPLKIDPSAAPSSAPGQREREIEGFIAMMNILILGEDSAAKAGF
jgi:hypothetical protein